MTDRERFLERIRERQQQQHRFPVSDPEGDVQKSVLGADVSTPELIDHFTRMLEDVGGHVVRVPDSSAVQGWLTDFVGEREMERAVITGDVPVENLAAALSEANLNVTTASADGAFRDACIEADVGITGADFVIADTGTLVLLTRSDAPRSASLLPPAHVAIVRSEQFVPNLPVLVERLRAGAWDDGVPSAMTLITGPSRTGDIEQTLSIGVHGPGEVYALILEG